MKKLWISVFGVAFALLVHPPPERAAAETNLKAVRVASGLTQPLEVTAPPVDADRVFIVEQPGRVRVLKGDVLLGPPFLDISGLVNPVGEGGLLGLAFHPDYETNGYFFVSYTRSGDGASVIARYTVSADPDVADPTSRQEILSFAQPYGNHNGGKIAFGPLDGYLYIGSGDGGSSGDPLNNAQNLGSLLGKILRIDVDGGSPYAVPPDNPFVDGDPATRDEIWAYGLRNPWKFSFDSSTGDLYIGDVGQGAWEEIDYAAASSPGGENYGWRCYEGAHPYNTGGCVPIGDTVVPILEYDHGQGCSVTGGHVYRGAISSLQGAYFYGDFCSAWIRTFAVSGGVPTDLRDRTAQLDPGEGLAINLITSFGEDALGELYVCDRAGEVFKIVPNPDIDDDETVGSRDLGILMSRWGSNAVPEPDLNLDGDVDVDDLALLEADWS